MGQPKQRFISPDHQEDLLDEALAATFPGSDAPSVFIGKTREVTLEAKGSTAKSSRAATSGADSSVRNKRRR
jgi:hypothetical protein